LTGINCIGWESSIRSRDSTALALVIDTTGLLTPAGGGALLPVWTSTGFSDHFDLIAVPGRRLYPVPTPLPQQRDRHHLGDRATGTRLEIVDLPTVRRCDHPIANVSCTANIRHDGVRPVDSLLKESSTGCRCGYMKWTSHRP
jgi:hypothetical protein